jgi:dTDP-4-amino-4,6-dideoxygalactose transaminase
MIHFNVPPFTGKEFDYMKEAVGNKKICGDGHFTKECDAWMEERFGAKKALLTTSGSTALDMAALLCGLKPGDEVILPSFTFPSTANSFVLAGAKLFLLMFVQIL